jgi:antirestriction protein ArdC
LGAAFLCAHLGVEGQLRHAEYIASWLSLLKEDDRAIFTAASKASAAADYLRSLSEKVEEDA